MGAFDFELAALGISATKDPEISRQTGEPAEPKLGARVMACEPVDRLPGTVVYCSEETVVVRFDRPHKGKWREERERSYYRPNTHFYLATTNNKNAAKGGQERSK